MSNVTHFRETSFVLPEAVERQIEAARRVILQAHSITAVAAAAASSEAPASENCTQTTLQLVSKILNDAAAMIDPMALLHVQAASERADPEVANV
jgi:hypothetical protein